MFADPITSYIDVPQVVLYAFWIFFAGLIYYLRREDKREGYPLESERSRHVTVQGFPAVPPPKVFRLSHGGTVQVPRPEASPPLQAQPAAPWPGAPLVPTGNPMRDGVGPAAWSQRADVPDMTLEGEPKIVPLRAAPGFFLESRDPNPVGMTVLGADGRAAGVIRDVWVDRSEVIARYFEVELSGPDAAGHRVLLPVVFSLVDGRARKVRVQAILASQFAGVPRTRQPEQITMLEEERVTAYFGGGCLYATPDRQEPLL